MIQRVHAIEWLGEFDEDPKEVIAVLKNAHKDESVLVKLAAAVALGKLGVGVEGVDTTLIAALKDKELPNGIRYLACIGLEHLGARAVDAVPVLKRSLTDDDSVELLPDELLPDELLPDELLPDDGDVEEFDGLDAFAPTVGHAAASRSRIEFAMPGRSTSPSFVRTSTRALTCWNCSIHHRRITLSVSVSAQPYQIRLCICSIRHSSKNRPHNLHRTF